MLNCKVGIRFRPILDSDVEKNVKWIIENNSVKSSDQKRKFKFGKLEL